MVHFQGQGKNWRGDGLSRRSEAKTGLGAPESVRGTSRQHLPKDRMDGSDGIVLPVSTCSLPAYLLDSLLERDGILRIRFGRIIGANIV